MTQPQRNSFEMQAHEESIKPHYHEKRYPHFIGIRLTDEQYNKVKGKTSRVIKDLIDTIRNSWLFGGKKEPPAPPLTGAAGKAGAVLGGKILSKQLLKKWGEEVPAEGAESLGAFALKAGGKLGGKELDVIGKLFMGKKLMKEMESVLPMSGLPERSKKIMGELGRSAIVQALSIDDLEALAAMYKRDAKDEIIAFLNAQLQEKKALIHLKRFGGTGMVETKTPKAGTKAGSEPGRLGIPL